MAKNDDLHNMAKKLYAMKKAQKPSRKEATPAPKSEPKTKPPQAPTSKKTIKKASSPNPDKSLMDKPVPKKSGVSKFSAPKEVAEELREGFQFDRAQAMKGGQAKVGGKKVKVSGQHAKLLDEHIVEPYVEKVSDSLGGGGGKKPPVKAFASELERDLPKGGKKMAVEAAEHLAPTATSKAEMAMIKSPVKRFAKKHLGNAVGMSLLGATLAGPVGLGLQALMESLDAEESNPREHDLAAEAAARKQKMNSGPAPRDQLQNELPRNVKKPRMRTDAVVQYGEGGPTDQQKMEDDYAEYLRKQPR